MNPFRVVQADLARTGVHDHHPAVREHQRIHDPVEQVGFLTRGLADRHQRFGADSPRKPGIVGGARILDDSDASAVLDACYEWILRPVPFGGGPGITGRGAPRRNRQP